MKFQSTLTPGDRSVLDALVEKLTTVNRGRSVVRPVDTWSRQIARAAPLLTKAECEALATYALGVASSGNSQQLQVTLQFSMDHEAQAFDLLSKVMKLKQQTTKNIINGIRG